MEDTMPQQYIPIDLFASEILLRFPLKTIVRCMAVCKSWYSVIKNPNFIANHLNRNLNESKDPCFFSLSQGSHSYSIVSENTLTHGAKFELPFAYANPEIIGSCNGLICLRICYGTGWGIFLYNPLLGRLKIVETFRLSHDYSNSLFGFGYNEPSNDFRLVRITFPTDQLKEIKVYSLSTNSWHGVSAVPPRRLIDHRTIGLYINGSAHWLTSRVFDSIEFLCSIVLFDFKNEVFREIILPPQLRRDFDLFEEINEFGGSVALLFSNKVSNPGKFDLWVMEENGASESWTRKFRFTLTQIFRLPVTIRARFTKNGKIMVQKLFSRNKKLPVELYDPENNQFRDTEQILNLHRVFDFKESLFLLDCENALSNYSPSDLFYWDL